MHLPVSSVVHGWGRGNYSSVRLMLVNIHSAWLLFQKMGIEIMVSSALSQSDLEIDVVIPVFNGVRYLEEQIESIATNLFRLQVVILRDDGSMMDRWI